MGVCSWGCGRKPPLSTSIPRLQGQCQPHGCWLKLGLGSAMLWISLHEKLWPVLVKTKPEAEPRTGMKGVSLPPPTSVQRSLAAGVRRDGAESSCSACSCLAAARAG